MEDPKELQGHKVCGEDSAAGNSPRAGCNDKCYDFLDGDRAADQRQETMKSPPKRRV